MTEAQLNTKQTSVQDLLSKIIDLNYEQQSNIILHLSCLNSPLGPMLAIADEKALYLLEFIESKNLEQEVSKLKSQMNAALIPGNNAPLQSIEKELKSYFSGHLKKFNTPIHFMGTSFQQMVWHALTLIPYGETRSYAKQAQTIGKPSAFRAVANANGKNLLAVIVPCHRIINSSGTLGGYAGGISRKKWLLDFEQNHR